MNSFVRIAAVVAALATTGAYAATQEWKPQKPVELIAINAPGGGSDRILRIMVNVLQTQKQTPVAMNVVNKPGGGGAVAYSYLNSHAGDGHYLLISNKSILTNHVLGNGPPPSEFTPIVGLFTEYISVTVRPDSPLKSARDVVERVRKDPGALSFGIATSLGNSNHQGVAVALREAGVDVRKLRNVIFPSGGAATTALMGGHIDVAPVTAAFAASLKRNNQVRVIAVAAPQRLPGVLSDVPTWREQGFEAVVTNWRGFVGPKGMSPAAVAYWEQAFRRLSDSEEWRKELETNVWFAEFLTASEMRKQMERELAEQRAIVTALGLVKQ